MKKNVTLFYFFATYNLMNINYTVIKKRPIITGHNVEYHCVTEDPARYEKMSGYDENAEMGLYLNLWVQ